MFDKIKNDPFIINIYKTVDMPEKHADFWAYHGLIHVNNVIEIAEKTAKQLNCDNEYIENVKIAALLHDIGMIDGKENHDIKSFEMAKKYFHDNNIEPKYKDDILEAIRLHRDAFDSNNTMAIILIFADKIDIKKTRLSPAGYDIIGLRQYQYIRDIDIIKNGNELCVRFIIDKECNRQELESWYFTEKVFKAIKSFAKHFEFDLKIMWNDDVWKMD